MLQEAVFDVEDLLDVIEDDSVQLKDKAESSAGTSKIRSLLKGKKKLQNFFSRSRSSDDEDMEGKVRKLLEKMEYIASQKDLLDLRGGTLRASLVDESEVYGMGEVGKTALAQTVFNNPKVGEHFELKAWVSVLEELDIYRVTKTILEEVTQRACDVTGLNALQLKLKECLNGKFLVVLDDIWCEKSADLSVMCLPLRHGAQGSKIIVTTRSDNVASIMGDVQTHHLSELPKEACWQLFVKKYLAFKASLQMVTWKKFHEKL